MKKTAKFLHCGLILFLIFTSIFSAFAVYSEEKEKEKKDTPPHVLFTIPSERFRLDKKLSRPQGVTSYKGDIYISDGNNHRIVAFNELGETLFVVGGKGSNPGQFISPAAIVADEESIFVADTQNCRVQVLDRKDGSFKYSIDFKQNQEANANVEGGEKQAIKKNSDDPIPISLELDTKNRLYVTFKLRSNVVIYDKKGDFKFQFGKTGSGDGEFTIPTSVSINNFTADVETKIYVVDMMNSRIQVFNEKGNFISKFGKRSDDVDGFLMPSVISVDNEGRSHIYDRAKNKILVFNKESKFLYHYGRDEKLAFAESLFIDANNLIYVADTLNSRIVVYGY